MKGVRNTYMEHLQNNIQPTKMQHMLGVADYMRDRAKDWGMDPDECYVVGFIHDLGYFYGVENHEHKSAEIARKLGMKNNIVFAIENHSETLKDFYNVTPLLAFLVEADLSVDSRGNIVGFEGRLKDIICNHSEDSDAYRSCKSNIDFVKEYIKKLNIAPPDLSNYKTNTRTEKYEPLYICNNLSLTNAVLSGNK